MLPGLPAGPVTPTVRSPYWLLQVNDAAGDRPPTAAVGRDAAQGGLGLYLVAELSVDHGWRVDADGGKTVWARIPFHEPPDATGTSDAPPRPRGGR
jgi:hypothetical protein